LNAPISTTVLNLANTYGSIAAGVAAAQSLGTTAGVITFGVNGTWAYAAGQTGTFIYENTGTASTSELVLVGQLAGVGANATTGMHNGTLSGSVFTFTA